MDVLGLFDGKIRVPLGDVAKFRPFVVTILTHELAHAMITEKTADQAPRWFQEGLAQHVEMVEEDVNPIAGYRDKENLASFPLIEPAISSYSPALIAIGYDESRWALHYVEHPLRQGGHPAPARRLPRRQDHRRGDPGRPRRPRRPLQPGALGLGRQPGAARLEGADRAV